MSGEAAARDAEWSPLLERAANQSFRLLSERRRTMGGVGVCTGVRAGMAQKCWWETAAQLTCAGGGTVWLCCTAVGGEPTLAGDVPTALPLASIVEASIWFVYE